MLISEDAQGLQQMLDSLHVYFNKWSLTVNVDKTKILVVFSSGVSFMKATSTLAGKALRSLYSSKSILREVHVPVNILFNLCYAYVMVCNSVEL